MHSAQPYSEFRTHKLMIIIVMIFFECLPLLSKAAFQCFESIKFDCRLSVVGAMNNMTSFLFRCNAIQMHFNIFNFMWPKFNNIKTWNLKNMKAWKSFNECSTLRHHHAMNEWMNECIISIKDRKSIWIDAFIEHFVHELIIDLR